MNRTFFFVPKISKMLYDMNMILSLCYLFKRISWFFEDVCTNYPLINGKQPEPENIKKENHKKHGT